MFFILAKQQLLCFLFFITKQSYLFKSYNNKEKNRFYVLSKSFSSNKNHLIKKKNNQIKKQKILKKINFKLKITQPKTSKTSINIKFNKNTSLPD